MINFFKYTEQSLYENGYEYQYDTTAPWIIRFTFDKKKLLDNGIVMEDVYLSIINYDPDRIKFTYSDQKF